MAPDADPRTTAPPPPGWGTGPRKLVRRPDDGHLGGVCAGVAEYLNVDPNIVRIAAAVLAITGPGIPAYLLAWVFVPAADGSALVEGFPKHPGDKRTQVIGIVLIALALSVLWGDWWSPARHWLVPLGLIGAGAWLLLRRDRDDDRPVPPPPAPPTPPGPSWSAPSPTSVVPAPPAPDAAGTTEAPTASAPTTDAPAGDDPVADPPTEDAMTDTTTSDVLDGTLAEPTPDADDPTRTVFAPGAMHWRPTPPGGGDPGGPGDTTAIGSQALPPPPAHLHTSPKHRRILGPLVFGALLLWGGIAWLAGVDVRDGLAIGLCILGLGFVLGAFIGGSKALVLPALLVGAALITTSVADIPWNGGIGDKRWDPATVAQVSDRYELAIGEGTLDLRDLDLAADDRPEIQVDLGIGHLVVLLPEGVGLDLHGEVGAGDIDLLDRADDGVGVQLDRTVDAPEGAGTIELDLHVGLGHLEVQRAA